MIVGMLGFIGSGKGTVADYLVDTNDFVKDSFASSLKDACANIFDWPRELLEGDTLISRQFRDHVDEWWSDKFGIKNFTPRLALQLVGTDSLRNHFHQDIWFLTLQNRIRKNTEQHTVICDVRFPNEIKSVLEEPYGYIVRLTRSPFGTKDAHPSESALDGFNWNREKCFVLDNAMMSIEEQNEAVKPIIDKIVGEMNDVA